jgi:glycosyltransferase involved in cell wall biosynthesis
MASSVELHRRIEARAAGREVAVLIPCYNEEQTIGEVIRQFRGALPEAEICVFDNNSSDGTAEAARRSGANVFLERRRGKGYVVQSMFRKIQADIYVIVDGDGTYPAQAVTRLMEPVLRQEADMVIGSRLATSANSHFRWLNRVGNRFFLVLLHFIFGVRLTDLLSGYRCFSRRLVRGLPLFGGGFETEAEMSRLSLDAGLPWETVRAELRNYSIMYPNASVAHWLFKCLALVPACLMPSRNYYALRASFSQNGVYRKARERWLPFVEPAHVDRYRTTRP